MCKVWGMKIENLPRCPHRMNTTSKLCFKENTQALSSKEAYKQIIGALIDAKKYLEIAWSNNIYGGCKNSRYLFSFGRWILWWMSQEGKLV